MNEAEVNRLVCGDGNQIAHPAPSGTTFRPLSPAAFPQIRMKMGVPALTQEKCRCGVEQGNETKEQEDETVRR